MPQRKGLLQILTEIRLETPGAILEHLPMPGDPEPGDPEPGLEPWETPEKKILPVGQWRGIVMRDLEQAPTRGAQDIITGPFYAWYRDDFGRAIIQAEHQGHMVTMFEEVWAGEPEV